MDAARRLAVRINGMDIVLSTLQVPGGQTASAPGMTAPQPAASGAAVVLTGIRKRFGGTPVLGVTADGAAAGVDLEARAGEFLTLVGPSGCGKSTLLRVVAGLVEQDAGSVTIAGAPADHLPPARRDVAMVFQSYALYPHLTVAQNIATPLKLRRLALAERLPLFGLLSPRRARILREIEAEVAAVARQLELEALLGRKPGQLSGGQRQRVALGRAMVRRPAVFLMDEPLSNLDAKLRVQMRGELSDLHRRLGTTFLYVTHDQTEAMTMSDRVAMMDRGLIRQLGTPAELYERPADTIVARFIGSPPINLVPVAREADGGLTAYGRSLPLAVGHPGVTTLGVRPEHLRLTRVRDDLPAATLLRRENLGSEWLWHLAPDAPGAEPLVARLSAEETNALTTDLAGADRVGLAFDHARLHCFAADGGRIETAIQPTGNEARP